MESIAHYQIDSVSFGSYTSQEIRKLSVLEISNVTTFDALSHPNPLGLCDLALGPLSKNDVCNTCRMGIKDCPGHFGHLTLPRPVLNPVFMRQMYQLLKLCCLECHHLLVSPIGLTVFIAQLDALDRGLDHKVEEIKSLAERSARDLKGEGKDVFILAEIIKREIDEMMRTDPLKTDAFGDQCRSIVEKRQKIMKDFLQGKLMKPSKSCHNCKEKKITINIVNNSALVRNAGKKKKAKTSMAVDGVKFNPAPAEEDAYVTLGQRYITPADAKDHLRKLWQNEASNLRRMIGLLNMPIPKGAISAGEKVFPTDVFFLDVIVVPPNKFRPLRSMHGRSFENGHTSSLNQIMIASTALTSSSSMMGSDETLTPSQKKTKEAQRLHYAWQRLQILCNRLYDSDMDKIPDKTKHPGVKQLIEKKEGLFRKHMMGKRVNYAARSVISPDPYIMADEVGIPVIFAKKLSFPQPVAHFNLKKMQQAILNGPEKHPGATMVQFEDGSVIRLKADDATQRLAMADKISSALHRGKKVPIVHRHLVTGDVMLLNRQPTLHKPSIMAHRARVLPGEKTLRMHYANCKCYNADFDGDEMNAHFPQSELARSEAYHIANVNYQYLVPKDGTPLSGLIQDHIVSATLLSVRGTFFTRLEFQNLVYGCLSFVEKPIVFPPPAIMKPVALWTGKQAVSTVILNLIPHGFPPPTVCIPSKVKPKAFEKVRRRLFTAGGTPLQEDEMCESQVVIRRGELLCGIVDKASIGPTQYGLVHCCFELYGGETSTALLSAFARLATDYLQVYSGLTLGIHDILVMPDANKKRREIMKRSESLGIAAVSDALGIAASEFTEELKVEKMREAHMHKDPIYMKQLDNAYKVQLDKVNNDISGCCLGDGLVKRFPENNLQLMIQAGAKGGTVNALQISCLLGQIELEGRRPPLMMSGKSLPSFEPYNSSPRAGGFIAGRFLTGIRPQEFFFHCMAGREGLIDTAVKTSRSGYLQRCLIKHLEGLVVNYDLTVRDSDGSVIQYQYGEDGLDILKSQLLNIKAIPTMICNKEALEPSKEALSKLQLCTDEEGLKNYRRQISRWEKNNSTDRLRTKRGTAFLDFYRDEHLECATAGVQVTPKDVVDRWFKLDKKVKNKLNKFYRPCPDPVMTVFQPNVHFGVLSEKLDKLITDYATKNPHKLLTDGGPSSSTQISASKFIEIVSARHMRALAEPGEAVGLIAAQSVGEPSTQMTLNTFHFAGRGEMNVTLGIPRLREILMTASPNISTPSMDIPLRTDLGDIIEKEAEKVRLLLNSVRLSDVLEYVDVTENLHMNQHDCCRVYKMKFQFLPYKFYKKKYNVSSSRVLNYFETKFVMQLVEAVNKKMKTVAKTNSLFDKGKNERETKTSKIAAAMEQEEADEEDAEMNEKRSKAHAAKAVDDDDASSDDEDGTQGDTSDSKMKARHNQDLDYEEPEEVEVVVESDHEEDNAGDETVLDKSVPLNESDPDHLDQTNEGNDLEALVLTKHVSKKEARKKLLVDELDHRARKVTSFNPFIASYSFDTSKEEWCEIGLKYDIEGSKLDMATLVQDEAKKALVYKVGKIDRAFLVKDNEAAQNGVTFDKMIKTEGVSFLNMVRYGDVLDLNRMYSNDLHAIANTYGIEAAARAIKREISNVFAVYGIQVDSRHLSLISDYMTFDGTIKGMNRMSMASHSSPLQQMTFETTTAFLKQAALIGSHDDLKSPSARIFAGRATMGGTGMFDLIQDYKVKPPATPRLKKINESFSINWSPSSKDYPKRKKELADSVNKKIKF